MAALADHKRVAMRSPHTAGKTALAAWVVLWVALTRDGCTDWKVITTAGVARQLYLFLWPEIHKWARELNWENIPRREFDPRWEMMTQMLRLKTGYAAGATSDDPRKLEGGHASCILYVIDEAKTVPDEVWNSIEGALMGAPNTERMALAISTPGYPQGRFYDIHARKPGYEDWWVKWVRIQELIDAGRVEPNIVERRAAQWGERSSVYRQRVLAEFAADDVNAVVPLTWIEEANARWQEWQDAGGGGKVTAIGVDVSAGVGRDKSVIAVLYDDVRVGELQKYSLAQDPRKATMELTGHVVALLKKHGDVGKVIVDATGVGAGVAHRIAELGYGVQSFIAGAKATAPDITGTYHFADTRSAAWWGMRDKLNPDSGLEICLPPDNELIGDLSMPTYELRSDAVIKVESKDDLRKRLHRSPDCADAVMQAVMHRLVARKSWVYA